MRLRFLLGPVAALLAAAFLPLPVQGQVYTWTPDEMIKYTSHNPYGRFPDGRPKVPDELLAKVKGLSAAGVNLERSGYLSQFVDSLLSIHAEKKLVGRAVTLQLAPARPDVTEVVQGDWRAKGNQRPIDHQTALDTLVPGDVIVIDSFGSMPVGGIIGDNLAFYIQKKTGTGFVIDGPIRDIDGISELDMPGFFKGAEPTYIRNTVVMGINIPVRVGATTVMPGDVVLGDRSGVVFIPPQLVQGVVDAAETARRQ